MSTVSNSGVMVTGMLDPWHNLSRTYFYFCPPHGYMCAENVASAPHLILPLGVRTCPAHHLVVDWAGESLPKVEEQLAPEKTPKE